MCQIHAFSWGGNLLPAFLTPDTTVFQEYPDTSQLRQISKQLNSKYILIYTGTTKADISRNAVDRLLQVAEMSGADLLYSDYSKVEQGRLISHPTLDYQSGSLRDDFDFGPLILYRSSAFCEAVRQMEEEYRFAALYDLRLRLSVSGNIVRLPEFLYSIQETDFRLSGEKQFDYVNPRNRSVQIEMEAVCTAHLKSIGAWLPPHFRDIDLRTIPFTTEASVIIPVRNRVKTIAEAVQSALNQQVDFSFNVIVVDNHSDDGTTEILRELSLKYHNLIHHIPEEQNLGIGGCWTAAIELSSCGKFAIQLDSDDLYSSPKVLQTIVDTFYRQNCAMVIGSYQMVNFHLEEIPPGIIDHREWTPDNGRNNALRINGLGAPRAFYTPILRQVKFPDVSYGEDYATALAISRDYRIGRIYQPLYLCRRWEENSDASLDINRLNTYNFYKDKIRTFELLYRKKQLCNK